MTARLDANNFLRRPDAMELRAALEEAACAQERGIELLGGAGRPLPLRVRA
jgi:hypothetical protein